MLRFSTENPSLGISTDCALEHFRRSVNRTDTMFSTDHWLMPKLEQLRTLLSDSLTKDQAQALDDVLHSRRFMKDLIDWLESPPMSWADFFPYREQRDRDRLWESWKKSNRQSKKRQGGAKGEQNRCPECGSLAIADIVYGLLSEETMEAKRRGAVDFVQGGCCLPSAGGPRWYCRECKLSWPNGTRIDED